MQVRSKAPGYVGNECTHRCWLQVRPGNTISRCSDAIAILGTIWPNACASHVRREHCLKYFADIAVVGNEF